MIEHWRRKFGCAFKGVLTGAAGQSSFAVHYLAAVGVIVAAAVLQCEAWQWVALLMCIGSVLSLEYANSALEHLAKGLCNEHNSLVGKALDIMSAAVLVACVTSAIIACIIFGSQIAIMIA
jgi:undecaprenol kinase/diacylglycerol kinase (ATP)